MSALKCRFCAKTRENFLFWRKMGGQNFFVARKSVNQIVNHPRKSAPSSNLLHFLNGRSPTNPSHSATASVRVYPLLAGWRMTGLSPYQFWAASAPGLGGSGRPGYLGPPAIPSRAPVSRTIARPYCASLPDRSYSWLWWRSVSYRHHLTRGQRRQGGPAEGTIGCSLGSLRPLSPDRPV
jgi:hypothetical protein